MITEVQGTLVPAHLLVRRVESRGGLTRVVFDFDPRWGWANVRPRVQHRAGMVVCSWGPPR